MGFSQHWAAPVLGCQNCVFSILEKGRKGGKTTPSVRGSSEHVHFSKKPANDHGSAVEQSSALLSAVWGFLVLHRALPSSSHSFVCGF